MSADYSGTPFLVSLTLLVAVAVVGGWVAFQAAIAYRERRTRPFLFLGAGLLVIAAGTPGLWMGTYLVTDDLVWCSTMAFAGLLIGLILVLVSLRTQSA